MHSLLSGQGFKQVGNSSAKGPEWQGPCPVCGGVDRFHVWPEQGQGGSFWCRNCDKGGDLVEYYRWSQGSSYQQACNLAGVEVQQRHELSAPTSKPKQVARVFAPVATVQPQALWSDHAAKFAHTCHQHLLKNAEQCAWLQKRGIDRTMVVAYLLGWNPADTYRPRQSWALDTQFRADGRPKKLWLPLGLVIPQWIDGRCTRLRIRRPVITGDEPRYWVVPGSGREPLISNHNRTAFVVVESELDAILLDRMAGDLAGMVAMGNSSIKPTTASHGLFEAALHLSISLDSDPLSHNQRTGAPQSAGATGSRWWLSTYRQAERVPIIGGKDPGEAYQAGVDLRAWVLAGLPPRFHLKARQQGSPDPVVVADAPVVALPDAPVVEPQPLAPGVRVLTLTDGRVIHITSDRAEWQDLVDAGQLAFSEQELLRLQAACASMTPAEKTEFVRLVVDAKEVFNNGYISRGEVVE